MTQRPSPVHVREPWPHSPRASRLRGDSHCPYLASRLVICAVVATSFGSLAVTPSTWAVYLVDVLLRSYVIFVGTVMAHEGTHGHLGRSRTANEWWGRLALLPCSVPYTNFRKTHHLHHLHTNLPDEDPDLFLKSRFWPEIPLRAVALPHYWFLWLWRRGRIDRRHVGELLLNYVGIVSVYLCIAWLIGLPRLLSGMAPCFVLVSILLWYPFAIKTHEGFSTGPEALRSHDYYGHFMFWFSFGLSMHRVHHANPWIPWTELRHFVQEDPRPSRWRLLPRRDIQVV